ncbi:vomeronasal type-1 receptor 1-like [Notamacropus eugenii]|uniref:vomeronasal type-1 receptor 1-like n=1 Tax=Notamacropus eugenii TaxID=9315 RepID=UPI003B66FDFE
MSSNTILLSIVFSLQTSIGLLGNSFLLYFFIIKFFVGHKLRPIDTILMQLVWVNSLVLLFKGIPETLANLGLKNFLDDNGCKTVFYIHKVCRGLSISMTCLLSGFQAITINPSSYRWANCKAKATKSIIPCSLLCWFLQLLLNIMVLGRIQGTRASKNSSKILSYGYCIVLGDTTMNPELFAIVVALPDVMCVGFMVSASGYMLLLLNRHHKRVKQIHMTSLSSRASPEIRATQSVLLLVTTFVCFYSLNFIFFTYMHFRKPRPWLVQCSAFLGSCFPTFSSFVLISRDTQVHRCHYGFKEQSTCDV